MRARPGVIGVIALLALPLPLRAEPGEAIFLSTCAPCHGAAGRGDGPEAWLAKQKPSNLRDGPLRSASVAELVAKIRSGRELALPLDTEAVRARAKQTESLIAFLEKIPGIDWEKVEPGEVIYSLRCSSCHGLTGKATEPPPPGVATPRDLSSPEFQQSVSEPELIVAVRHGRAHMPALMPRISEADGRLVAAYVRLFSPGYTTYEELCMACHGRDGRGVGTLGEEMPLPTTTFDAAYFERTDPEVLRARVWHMLAAHGATMPHYRRILDEAQMRAVAEYIKQAWGPKAP